MNGPYIIYAIPIPVNIWAGHVNSHPSFSNITFIREGFSTQSMSIADDVSKVDILRGQKDRYLTKPIYVNFIRGQEILIRLTLKTGVRSARALSAAKTH
jgi:hypothetical protein